MQTIKLHSADTHELGCSGCRDNEHQTFNLSFAFQPIVRASTRKVVSYEALARGPEGQGFAFVRDQINSDNLYNFDQTCRVRAIELATRLKINVALNINFTPNAVYRPELCIRTTLAAAQKYGFPVEKIHFEVTESEEIREKTHLVNIIETYKKLGFTTVIDDFGAGFSGLNLLAEFQPDYIKIDRALIDHVDQRPARQAIIQGVILTCRKLNIDILAEGVEREEEYRWLAHEGIDLFQGYYFAYPGFKQLPGVPDELF
ncbi:EAL domain-containing protein [Pseudohongiella acticola]|uniref:EAL domain-containing protein n=1 Tax=Pseudohongiella acticola TaxID=1524254 RepID=UPI000A95868C|nr:EAL domain-containing protein [Pseudohongiella acticola]